MGPSFTGGLFLVGSFDLMGLVWFGPGLRRCVADANDYLHNDVHLFSSLDACFPWELAVDLGS